MLHKDGTWKDKRCINHYPCLCERSQTKGVTTSLAYNSFAAYIRTPRYTAAAYHQARIVAILVAVIMLIPPLLVGIGVLGGRCTLGTRLVGVSHCEKWEPTLCVTLRSIEPHKTWRHVG